MQLNLTLNLNLTCQCRKIILWKGELAGTFGVSFLDNDLAPRKVSSFYSNSVSTNRCQYRSSYSGRRVEMVGSGREVIL